MCSAPLGATPIPSVNVPPRSIQNDQPALIGAWLGFNTVEGLFAVVTTIVGATVGANVAFLALDIARDRKVHDRVAATDAKETLEVRPSTG